MPKYQVTERESNCLLTGAVEVPEQNYDKYRELTYKEIRENEEALNNILIESYGRLAIAWMRFLKDDDFERFFSKLREKVKVDAHQCHLKRMLKDDETDVSKVILQGYMFSILIEARNIDEEYYRAAIQFYQGQSTPFLFSPEAYDVHANEVDYESEFKKNHRFWLGEVVEYICAAYKTAVDENLMPFISSTVLNRAKDYFLKFEEAGEKAKNVINKIKNNVRMSK